MLHIVSSGGIPGPDGLQEILTLMTVGDRLIDNIPSIDIVRSIFGQGFDILHCPLDVFLEFLVKDCLICLPLQPARNDVWDFVSGTPDEGVSSELHSIVDGVLECVDTPIEIPGVPRFTDNVHFAFVLCDSDVVLGFEVLVIPDVVILVVHVDCGAHIDSKRVGEFTEGLGGS